MAANNDKCLLQDLADRMAAHTGTDAKEAESFLKQFFDLIENVLKRDSIVRIKGFGTFKLVSVDKRESINVNTGERIAIDEHAKIVFTPDNSLKEYINRPFAHFQTVILNDDTNTADMESPEMDEKDDVVTPDDTEMDDPQIEAEEENEADNETVQAVSEQGISERVIPEEKKEQSPTEEPISTDQPAREEEKEKAETLQTEKPSPEEEEEETKGDTIPPIAQTEPTDAEKEAQTAAEEKEEDLPVVEKTAETERQLATEEPQAQQREATVTTVEAESEKETPKTETIAPPPPQPPLPNPVNESDTNQQLPRINWWKVIALGFIVLFLMLVSYLVGYFRILCPCDYLQSWSAPTEQIVPPEPPAPPRERKSVATKEFVRPDSAQATRPTVKKDTLKEAPKPAAPQKASAPKPKPTPVYSQVPNGRYTITGTLKIHTVEAGETIRDIALATYGSKGYAQYIIVHNHLSNPDRIEAGQQLKLPRLVRRRK